MKTLFKPTVIGLYGLPGSGKSTLLKGLKKRLSHGEFDFYEGSEAISSLVPGGLEAFQAMDDTQKRSWREIAINWISENCRQRKKVAIVTGHLMFFSAGEHTPVYTTSDMKTYTYIIYLDVPVVRLAAQRQRDTQRPRPECSVEDLEKWQKLEIDNLSILCQNQGILFSRLAKDADQLLTAFNLIRWAYRIATVPNDVRVDATLNTLYPGSERLETMLVVDGDKTLSTDDTGITFWAALQESVSSSNPLKDLFSGPLEYSETAFLQATLLYEEATDEEAFERTCGIVASRTQMHPDFISLFGKMAKCGHVRALVLTCGIRRVWEKILAREGLSQAVKVIGGGRISDDVVVTAEVKARIVSNLRGKNHLYVCVFGDGPLDLPMLETADVAIVVTGEEGNRSQSMDSKLLKAIETRGLKARQVLLPRHVSPRLTVDLLPQVSITDDEVVHSLLSRRYSKIGPGVWHASNKKAAQLLTSPTRDASVGGPSLRKAHGRVGLYLAWEFLSELLGVEEYAMKHVQGHTVSGHRIRHEHQTTIVALMRAGEPMALELNEALPLAMFVHATSPEDMKREHLGEQKTIILVDSVINSGETLTSFIEYARRVNSTARIVVVAGVAQQEAVSEGHPLTELMKVHDVHLGALRLSENKFKGRKGTDTGNRLFNTTHMN